MSGMFTYMDRDEYVKFVRETIAELDGIMKVSVKDQVKDIAKSAMGRSVRSKDPMFWPAGMLLLGLVEARGVLGRDSLADDIDASILRHVSLWKKGYRSRIDYIDDALAGAALLRLYEQGSTGAVPLRDELKELCIYAAKMIYKYLMSAPLDPEGTIVYNPGRNAANVFADGVGQTTMFLSLCGRIFEKEEAISLARTQLMNYMKYGCDDKKSLIYHGYSLEKADEGFKAVKKGVLSWGRASGWLIMGLSEYLRSIFRSSSPEADRQGDAWMTCQEESGMAVQNEVENIQDELTDDRLLEWFRIFGDKLWSYQREDGCFSWQIQAVEGPVDTSATGMIAYGLAGFEYGAVLSRLDAAAAGMNDNISSSKVRNALSSCDDFGVHYQTYGHYPWGQGAVLAAMSRIMKCK